MRRTTVMVRRLALLAVASAGLLVVTTEPAQAYCSPGCCPWDAVQAVAPAPAELPPVEPAPNYCSLQHCEPVLRH